MLPRLWRVGASILLSAALCGCSGTCLAQGQAGQQAVLKLNGDFPAVGGFRVTEAPVSGPGANLRVPGDASRKGILEEGDIITRIAGKAFRDRREFLELMNSAFRDGKGAVRITVRDVISGNEIDWIAYPELAPMKILKPDEGFNFLSQLGPPVSAAPDVPKVPVLLNP